MFTIYRPYPDIEQSVASLCDDDLHLMGRLNVSLVIKAILAELDLIIYDTDLLETNETAKWYWNQGNPYLNDLMYYYNVAEELWLDAGGGGFNYLADCEDILENCEYIENEAKWNEHHARLHQLVMLKQNWQWYKRKFLPLKHHEIIDPALFINGKPRKVTKSNLLKQCRIIEHV